MWVDSIAARHRRKLAAYRELAVDLGLTEPFDGPEFLNRVQIRRGRPLTLLPIAGLTGALCGLWVRTDGADVVCYAEQTSPLHQLQIIVHEVAHMVLGHEGTPLLADLAGLLPHLGSHTVTGSLGRNAYSDPQELDAELFATVGVAATGLARPSETVQVLEDWRASPAVRLALTFEATQGRATRV